MPTKDRTIHSHPEAATGGICSERRRMALAAAAALAVAEAWPLGALADEASDYPKRPVRMVVVYAAGNLADLVARVIAEALSARWGQPVTVDNRPGQGGSLGAQSYARVAPDGYTLLFCGVAAMAVNPHLYANVGYDARRDFIPIINTVYPDFVLVASPQLGLRTFEQLVAYSKQNPRALNYGTAGNGTIAHLTMEAIKQRTGLIAQHVPYKAAGAVLNDLIGGQLQLQLEAVGVLLPHVKTGKLIPLAVGPRQRHPEMPDVPSLSQLIPGYTPVAPWLGIFSAAGTPDAVVARVSRDMQEILAQPAVRNRLASHGVSIAGGSPQDFATEVRGDYDRLGSLVQLLKLKVD